MVCKILLNIACFSSALLCLLVCRERLRPVSADSALERNIALIKPQGLKLYPHVVKLSIVPKGELQQRGDLLNKATDAVHKNYAFKPRGKKKWVHKCIVLKRYPLWCQRSHPKWWLEVFGGVVHLAKSWLLEMSSFKNQMYCSLSNVSLTVPKNHKYFPRCSGKQMMFTFSFPAKMYGEVPSLLGRCAVVSLTVIYTVITVVFKSLKSLLPFTIHI